MKKIIVILFLLLIPSAVLADCLTLEQQDTIKMMVIPLNLTLEQTLDILDVFEAMCFDEVIPDQYNDTLVVNNITHLTEEINIVKANISDSTWFIDYLTQHSNNTSFEIWGNTTDQISKWNTEFTDQMEDETSRYENILDDKIESLKRTYVNQINFDTNLTVLQSRIYALETKEDPVLRYAFFLAIFVIVAFIADSKLHISDKFFGKIKNVKSTRRDVHELTTQDDYKKSLREIRLMKKYAVTREVSDDNKQKLIRMVDDKQFETEQDIDDAVEIMNLGTSFSKKDVSKTKKKKR